MLGNAYKLYTQHSDRFILGKVFSILHTPIFPFVLPIVGGSFCPKLDLGTATFFDLPNEMLDNVTHVEPKINLCFMLSLSCSPAFPWELANASLLVDKTFRAELSCPT